MCLQICSALVHVSKYVGVVGHLQAVLLGPACLAVCLSVCKRERERERERERGGGREGMGEEEKEGEVYICLHQIKSLPIWPPKIVNTV
jgi:hypothetical protein